MLIDWGLDEGAPFFTVAVQDGGGGEDDLARKSSAPCPLARLNEETTKTVVSVPKCAAVAASKLDNWPLFMLKCTWSG